MSDAEAGASRFSRACRLVEPGLVVLTVSALAVGGIAWLGGWRTVADGCWIAGTVVAVVPVDGRIVGSVAVLDESVLTGEPLQVERGAGESVRSGVVNAGTAFEMRATASADDSTYAGIVRLAEQAGAENAPIVRLADRYAAWFLPLTLMVSGAAWLASGSAVRAVDRKSVV